CARFGLFAGNLLRQRADARRFHVCRRPAVSMERQIAAEVFHTDGYIPVAENERGPVDTVAASEHTTLQVGLDRLISDRGRIFARGSLFGESRENGTPLTPNRTHIRQLALGVDWSSERVGSIVARLFTSTQVYNQDFSAVAADRRS